MQAGEAPNFFEIGCGRPRSRGVYYLFSGTSRRWFSYHLFEGNPAEGMSMIDQLVHTDAERQANAMPWKEVVAKYQEPSMWRSIWQITNSLVPYAVLWYLMYLSLSVSYWLTVPLA